MRQDREVGDECLSNSILLVIFDFIIVVAVVVVWQVVQNAVFKRRERIGQRVE